MVRSLIEKHGWLLQGSVNLDDDMGVIVLACKKDAAQILMQEQHDLVGFLPCSVAILRKEGKILIGTGQANIMSNLTNNVKIIETAEKLEQELKAIVHEAGDVQPQKVEEVVLYSTSSCQYCVMEKKWLDEKKVKYRVRYVDQDQNAADEMIKKTKQMGVPVTEVVYDDGDPAFVVGFDTDRLASLLEITA